MRMVGETRQLHVRGRSSNDDLRTVGFFVHELEQNIIYADDVIAEAYGFPHEEARRGLPLRVYMDKVHPDDVETIQGAISGMNGEGVFRYSHRIGHGNGSIVRARSTGYAFYADGVACKRVGMIELAEVNELTPIERFVDHCLITYQLAGEAGQPKVQYYVGLALQEIGFALAKTMRPK